MERGLLLLPFGLGGCRLAGKHADCPAQPARARRARRRRRLSEGGLDGGRQAVSQIVGRDPDALDEAGVCPRRDRKPRGEFLRRRRRAGVLAGGRRTCRRRGLQGDQHRRQHDRPSDAAPSRFRLRGRAARRSRQPAGVAAVRAADRGRRGYDQECLRIAGMDGGLARRAPPSLAERRLAGGGDGRRARASRSPARASMAASWSTTRSWAMAAATPNAQDIRAALALYRRADAMLIALVAALALAVIAPALSSRSRSTNVVRCLASRSSVLSTSSS